MGGTWGMAWASDAPRGTARLRGPQMGLPGFQLPQYVIPVEMNGQFCAFTKAAPGRLSLEGFRKEVLG